MSGAQGSNRVKWKVDPLLACESTQIVPPINSASRREIASPSPVEHNNTHLSRRYLRYLTQSISFIEGPSMSNAQQPACSMGNA